jgi:DDE superfamily endonuclease
LLLDEALGHRAILSQVLAAQIDIVLVWLPKQCSEHNAMDQLWKEFKGDLAANRQFKNID